MISLDTSGDEVVICIVEDNMCVRSSKAKRIDANTSDTFVWPRYFLCRDSNMPVLEGNSRAGIAEMQARRYEAMLQYLYRFDDAS
jgi:hypothetical protein